MELIQNLKPSDILVGESLEIYQAVEDLASSFSLDKKEFVTVEEFDFGDDESSRKEDIEQNLTIDLGENRLVLVVASDGNVQTIIFIDSDDEETEFELEDIDTHGLIILILSITMPYFDSLRVFNDFITMGSSIGFTQVVNEAVDVEQQLQEQVSKDLDAKIETEMNILRAKKQQEKEANCQCPTQTTRRRYARA